MATYSAAQLLRRTNAATSIMDSLSKKKQTVARSSVSLLDLTNGRSLSIFQVSHERWREIAARGRADVLVAAVVQRAGMWELLPIMRGSGYSLYECSVSLVFCHHGSAHTSAKLVAKQPQLLGKASHFYHLS